MLRQGDTTQARPVLAEALRLADSCGAAWHAERARVLWRRAGGRARSTPSGALTPQEQAVADLARSGRTNKEIAGQLFLSVNTVETHLAHVFRKLGISRRWGAHRRCGEPLRLISPAGETVWRRSHRIPGRPGELRPAHFGHAGGQPRTGARRLRRRTRPG